MTKNNLQQWIESSRQMQEKSREFSRLEVYSIASSVLRQPREWLITHDDYPLNQEQIDALNGKFAQLKCGVPLPYIINHQAFYGLDFFVTPDVLIPRPETELLVETAIEWLRVHPSLRSMIDVGTGSGIIPITIVDNIPNLSATAIDYSEVALKVASINVDHYSLQSKIKLVKNDLLTGLDFKSDLITANLPYIPSDRLPSLEVTRFEPLLALDGGKNGFEIIRKLLGQLPEHLNPGGLALLEIDFSQAELCLKESSKIMTSATIDVINDMANLPRLLKIQN